MRGENEQGGRWGWGGPRGWCGCRECERESESGRQRDSTRPGLRFLMANVSANVAGVTVEPAEGVGACGASTIGKVAGVGVAPAAGVGFWSNVECGST